MKKCSKSSLFSIAMAAFLLFTPISHAALKFDNITTQQTTIEQQLKALDTPIKLKSMDDFGSALLMGHMMISKHLFLSTKERNIAFDEKGNIAAFLICEMSELNGTYIPVIKSGQTDSLIIKCYPGGKYGAFHAVAELNTGGQAPPEIQKKEADALQKMLKVQAEVDKEKAAGTYDSAKWAPISIAAYNDYMAVVKESGKYRTPYYDWKAVGQEIKIDLTHDSEDESKWLANRKSVILKAHTLLQEVVNKRKVLKAQLAAIK